jgi:hypothetical protein
MNGFMTLLTGALALLILGLMVFLVGEGSNTDSFASPDSLPPVTQSQQASPLSGLSSGGSGTCQEDGDVYDVKTDSKLTETTDSVVSGEPESVRSAGSEHINDLILPEGLRMDITGTGETCK